uniref:IclR family transcriptional regulator domain-containing protein n=1 Tax=Streptomyces xanthophaeus TaxID=67385 RepID=UPI0038694301
MRRPRTSRENGTAIAGGIRMPAERTFTLPGFTERLAVPRPVLQQLLESADQHGMGELHLSASTMLALGPSTPGAASRPRPRAEPATPGTGRLPELPPAGENTDTGLPEPRDWRVFQLRYPDAASTVKQALAPGSENRALHKARLAHRVIRYLEQHPVGVQEREISAAVDLPSSALGPVLVMLCEEEFAITLATGVYGPGPALDRLSSPGGLSLQLQHTLSLARDTVGAAVYRSRYVDGEVAITQVADGPLAPRVNEWVDFRAAHASAVGKCLLTQLPRELRADHLTRHGTARLTHRTITHPQLLSACF